MKAYIFCIVFSISFFLSFLARSQSESECIISGIVGLPTGDQCIYFSYKTSSGYRTDTVAIKNTIFRYLVPYSLDGIIDIRIKNFSDSFFWQEKGNVYMKKSDKYSNKISITGTPENDILNLYNEQISWPYQAGKLSEETKEEKSIDFIDKYYYSKTSVYLLFNLVVLNEKPKDRYIQLFNNLSYKLKQLPITQNLYILIEDMKKKM